MGQAPVARFLKSTSGLSVQFTDSSLYVPTSWNWAFGDGNTATNANPAIVYAAAGTYHVVLTVANSFGSSTLVYTIVVSTYPTLNQSIAEMVACAVPVGIEVSGDCFDQNKAKWQLYLQPLIELPLVVNPNDVFNEALWPPLLNILISKLIIYEAILQASASSALAFVDTATTPTPITVAVADYVAEAQEDITVFPNLIVNFITINNTNYPYQGSNFANLTAMVNWLNSLNLGIFISSDVNTIGTPFEILSYGNSNIINDLNLTSPLNGTYSINFTSINQQIVNITPPALDGGPGNATQGSIRYIETGPSKVEWYDKSIFWKNIMAEGGVMAQLTQEICGFAERLRVKLPMCKLVVETPLFIVSRPVSCSIYHKLGGLWDICHIACDPQYYLPNYTLAEPVEVLFTNTLSFTVNHDLGRYPFVNVVDSDGNQPLFGITHTNPNSFSVLFLTPLSGTITYF